MVLLCLLRCARLKKEHNIRVLCQLCPTRTVQATDLNIVAMQCVVALQKQHRASNKAGLNGTWVKQDILDKTKVEPGKVSAFVELHIEQGPLLEREGLQIGVVTAIAAPASFRVQFNGDGGHAGALLMHDRSADNT